MIKHVETPFLHIDIKDGNCEVTGTGNTWHYLLLFAFAVKAAKEGQFTNGFANKYEEREFNRILNEEVLVRLYEGNAEMFIDVTGDSGMALIKDVINALECV